MPQQQFKGYSQDQMGRIASKLGHTGGLDTFDNYLNSNPSAFSKYNALKDTITQHYARGGMVKSGYAVGGLAAMSNQNAIQSIFKNPETGLGRSVGAAGLEYYSGKLDSATTPEARESMIQEIQQNILDSAEFQNRAATGGQQRYVSETNQLTGIDYEQGDNTANNAAIIQSRFQSDLGRAAGQTGQDYYTGLMDGSATGNPDDIRADIRGSKEGVNYAATGTQLYVPEDNRVNEIEYRNPLGSTIEDTNAATKAAAAKAIADAKAAADAANAKANPSDGTAQPTAGTSLGDIVAGRATAPGLVAGAGATPQATTTNTNQTVNFEDVKLEDTDSITNKDAALIKASAPTVTSANTATTEKTKTLATTDAAQGVVTPEAQVTAQTQATTNVGAIDAAQSSAIQVDGAPTRTLQTGADGKSGELVNPVADAQKAAAFTEQITAAQGDPSSRATVQGQLATLMTSFDEGKTPAWAAGAMRNVTAQMSARGIGSSSMAGQALIQAALEASLPIATADAQTYAQFDLTNLNNRQQRVMLAAQQRATFMGQEFDQAFQSRVLNSNKISEVANMRFTGDQQIALENSQAANTMQLNNLSNKQAIVMASASTMSQLEVTSLNNRQQAEVQNAQSFLDMDMSNLSNSQQAVMFDAQSRVQSMLTDAAAENATQQFNATSKNQTDQFFEGLKSQISQFNATQSNAQAQFNTGETNTIAKFNKEISNQRDQFNAQNRIVIDQSNAQWRRNIATADTAATNRANEINAKSVLDISNSAYNDLWQDYKDKSEWAWTSAESGRDRFSKMAIQKMSTDASITIAQIEADYQTSVQAGKGLAQLFLGNTAGSFLDSINPFT